ncbi:MAG TPA: PilN domain-containing protein [Candidatus Methylomirabilis sp.]|jgi:Tfp pilus assembly protein PilN|nr:PilN domain-containing protein [Candidatus Methylomirabilis sp.]
MRLALNLASPAARRRALLRRGLAGAVLLLLVATVVHGLLYARWRAHLASLEDTWTARAAEREEAGAGSGGATGPAQWPAGLAERVRFYNGLLEASAFSWTGLLNELEAALPEGVGLVEVRPDQQLTAVQLRGEARTLEALTGFVRRLEGRSVFTRVFLLRHGGRKDARSGREVLEFEIRLELQQERV